MAAGRAWAINVNEAVGHNSRDSTAIEAREKPLNKESIQKWLQNAGGPNQVKSALNR